MAPSNSAFFVILTTLSGAGCAGVDGGTEAESAPLQRTSAELTRNALTPAQEKTALKLIDDICGDTWCEGDDDFRFDALSCCAASQSCTLSLEIVPREGVPSPRRDHHLSCRTRHFTGFASLVDTAPNGYQSLDQDYYFALTDCISTLEAELPR
jgi:hypothetical protein